MRFIIPIAGSFQFLAKKKNTHVTNAWGHRSNDTSHQEREKIIKLLRIPRPGEEQGKNPFPQENNFRCGTMRYGCEYGTEPSPVGTNREVFRFFFSQVHIKVAPLHKRTNLLETFNRYMQLKRPIT